MAIIREMMSELGGSVPQPRQDQPESETAFSRMMEMCNFDTITSASMQVGLVPDVGQSDLCFDRSHADFLGFLDDQERTITNDTLYGLFAEQPPFF